MRTSKLSTQGKSRTVDTVLTYLILPSNFYLKKRDSKQGLGVTAEEVEEILEGAYTLDIPNFEKWNPPIRDKKTGETHEKQFRSFIKLSVHVFHDPKFHGLSKEERYDWLTICLRRATNGPITCQQGANILPTLCQRRANRVPTLIVKLLERQLIVLSKERKKERKKEEEGNAGNTKPLNTTKTANLSPLQISNLEKQFGKELVKNHVEDAIALWETKDDYQKIKTPLILTVQRYLKIEREKNEPLENKFTPEEMAKIKAMEAEFEK